MKNKYFYLLLLVIFTSTSIFSSPKNDSLSQLISCAKKVKNINKEYKNYLSCLKNNLSQKLRDRQQEKIGFWLLHNVHNMKIKSCLKDVKTVFPILMEVEFRELKVKCFSIPFLNSKKKGIIVFDLKQKVRGIHLE